MNRIRVVVIFLVYLLFIVLSLKSSVKAEAPQYQLIDLGTLPGLDSSIPKGINNKDQIVGYSYNAAKNYQDGDPIKAFIWENGEIKELPSDGIDSFAWSINDNGDVIGTIRKEDGQHTVLWQGDNLTYLDSILGNPNKINNKGQVVGFYRLGADKRHAYLWENGVFTDLEPVESNWSAANRINDEGQIVGENYDLVTGNFKAVLWTSDSVVDLWSSGQALDINNKNQVVGSSNNDLGITSAILWEEGVIKNLESLFTNSKAEGINDNGEIVGYSWNENEVYPILWNNEMTINLGRYNSDYTYASKINNRGQIIGYSLAYEQGDPNHAFLWNPILISTPTPTPTNTPTPSLIPKPTKRFPIPTIPKLPKKNQFKINEILQRLYSKLCSRGFYRYCER